MCMYIRIYMSIYLYIHIHMSTRLKVSSDDAAGIYQFIVYNQSKYCSFRPRVSGSTPGADTAQATATYSTSNIQHKYNGSQQMWMI